MIDIIFDVLGQLINAEIIKATATATGAVARVTAEAAAMPDSVATFVLLLQLASPSSPD